MVRFLMHWVRILAIYFCVCPALAEDSQKLPVAELGVGLVSQTLADYRGSSRYHTTVLPVPIAIYRGAFIKADGDGVRTQFFESDRLELNFSAEASLSGGGAGNPLREGMSKILSSAEVGPSLNINLSGRDFNEGWSLRLPVRGVFAVNFRKIEYIGPLFNPKLTWRKPRAWEHWELKANIGAIYGSRTYHDYFYSVDREYVTETRPYYQASSGYSGSYVKFSVVREFGSQWWIGGSLRYDNLYGVTFEDSPLVETRNYGAFSIGIVRMLWASG